MAGARRGGESAGTKAIRRTLHGRGFRRSHQERPGDVERKCGGVNLHSMSLARRSSPKIPNSSAELLPKGSRVGLVPLLVPPAQPFLSTAIPPALAVKVSQTLPVFA